jgi:hypothetical protein
MARIHLSTRALVEQIVLIKRLAGIITLGCYLDNLINNREICMLATVTWEESPTPEVIDYKVAWTINGVPQLVETVSGTSDTKGNLSPGDTVHVAVMAERNGKLSESVSINGIVPNMSAPLPPGNLQLTFSEEEVA